MKTIFGGYNIDAAAQRHQLPVVYDPDESIIEKTIVSISRGSVVMKIQPRPDMGPYELMLHVEDDQFLLMLCETDEDDEPQVRTPNVNNSTKGFTTILGEKYPAHSVIRDIQFVYSVFKEFARTGNVSIELLN